MNSMTGFGKSLIETASYQIEVELKSVNHRFLDIQIRAPRQVSVYEQAIRHVIKETLNRGRVDVFVTLREKGDQRKKVVLHWDLIEELVSEFQREAYTRFQMSFATERILEKLLDHEAFLTVEEAIEEDEQLESCLIEAVRQAALANAQNRSQEGIGLLEVLRYNHRQLEQTIEELRTFVDVYEAEYRERYEKKLQEYLGAQVDQERLLTELAILLERGDIHEELDRLGIHLTALNQLLAKTGPVGRELDFLIQEMNREVNTIGSKSTAIEIKNQVVQMKTTLEKIREQVQNIE